MASNRVRRGDGRYFELNPRDTLAEHVARLLKRAPLIPPTSEGSVGLGDGPAVREEFGEGRTEPPLTGISMLVVGAGAVGSWLLTTLSPYGGTYYCVDPDVVESRNRMWGRTVYEPEDDGKKKVYAFRDKVTIRWPQTEVVPIPYRLQDLSEAGILALVRNCALVIGAFDDGDGLFLLNRLVHSMTVCLYPAAHRQAASGHVIITTPYTPCLRCCMAVSSSRQITTLHGEPGVGVDFQTVAETCAKVALSILIGEQMPAFREFYDRRANILYISNRASDPVVGGVGIAPWWSGWDPDCPVCGRGRKEVK